jgi:hypothetical protein
VTEDEIWVTVDKTRQLTAVFESARKALVVAGGHKCEFHFNLLSAGAVLRQMHWDQVTPSGGEPNNITDKVPNCSIFAYNGHGEGTRLGIRYVGCNGYDYYPIGDPRHCTCEEILELCAATIASIPKPQYKLVYLLSCDSGNDSGAWKQAFNNAEAFVGFAGTGDSVRIPWFDTQFWQYAKTQDTNSAAVQAAKDVDKQYPTAVPKMTSMLRPDGSTMLNGCN